MLLPYYEIATDSFLCPNCPRLNSHLVASCVGPHPPVLPGRPRAAVALPPELPPRVGEPEGCAEAGAERGGVGAGVALGVGEGAIGRGVREAGGGGGR